MNSLSIHGGDIYRNKVRFDFSTNINPLGICEEIKAELNIAVRHCVHYPDIACRRLRECIAEMEGCSPEWVLCGNGASELFPAIVHALRPAKTLIPVPSFYGYERAVLAGGGKLCFYQLREDDQFQLTSEFCRSLTDDIDLLFLANPNNPTGCCIAPELLADILAHCRRHHITIVLDECFYDFLPMQEKKSIPAYTADFPELIVVKAFTKFFAVPGVRLGYLVCSDAVKRERIALQLPEWNVSGFAQAAGIAAAYAFEYRRRTLTYVAEERQFLVDGLMGLGAAVQPDIVESRGAAVLDGLKDQSDAVLPDGMDARRAAGFPKLIVYPSEVNFLLLYTKLPLYDVLLREGILIRDCANFRGLGEGYYRIAVRTREENEEFLRALERVMACEEGDGI